ncbi:MAG: hypothetical protein ABJA02_01780 [Acidobacteriota bacterium]
MLVQQKAIESARSPESLECERLAGEIVRVADELSLDSRDMGRRSAEWALISSLAGAGRGRLLSSAARRTTLTLAACFLADENGDYCFINNCVKIDHPTAGTAEFLVTAAVAIKFLASELGHAMEWAAEIPVGPPTFKPSVVLDAGPENERVFQGLQIQFYKLDPYGMLATYQPKDWQLELKSSV